MSDGCDGDPSSGSGRGLPRWSRRAVGRREATRVARDAGAARQRAGLGRPADRRAVGRAAAGDGAQARAGAGLAAAQAARRRRRGDRHARARLRAARRPRRASTRCASSACCVRARTARTLREALALWRGPPLDDLANEPFAAPEIRRLEDLWLRGARGRDRRRAGRRAPRGGARRARRAGPRASVARAAARAAHARAVPLRQAGGGAGGVPATPGGSCSTRSGSSPAPSCAASTTRSCARTRSSTVRRRRDRRPASRAPAPRWLLGAAAVGGRRGRSRSPSTQLGGSGGLERIAEDSAGVIDPGERADRRRSTPSGTRPDALAAGAGSVWSANGRDGTVSRIDRGRGQVTTIDVGGEPTALAFGGGSLWVADGETRPRRPGRLHARTASSAACPRATRRAAWRSTGGAVWVASAVDGQVQRLDLDTRRPAPPDRRPRRPGGDRRGRAARCGWPARRTASSPSSIPRSGAAAEDDRGRQRPGRASPSASAASGWPTATTGRSRGSTRPRTRSATRCRVGGTPGRGRRRARRDLGGGRRQGAVIRIDPDTRKVSRRIRDRQRAVRARRSPAARCGRRRPRRARSHRGGTLRYESRPRPGLRLRVHRPGGLRRGRLAGAVARLRRPRRLPSRRRAPAAARSSPTSPTSVPQPDDGGRTYTFQLRPGLRFSDGTPVRPDGLPRVDRTRRAARGQMRRSTAASSAPTRARRGGATSRRASRPTRGADDHHPPPAPRRRVPAQARACRWPTCSPRERRRRCIRGHCRAGNRPVHDHRRSRRGARCGWCATRAFTRGRARRVPTAFPTRSPSRSRRRARGAGRRRAARPLGRRRRRRALQRPELPLAQARALALADASRVHIGARAEHELPVPQRARAAVRRPAGPPGAQLRDRSPARGRARGRQRPREPVVPDDPARAARLRAHVPVHPRRRRRGRRLVGAGSRPRPPAGRGVRHPRSSA